MNEMNSSAGLVPLTRGIPPIETIPSAALADCARELLAKDAGRLFQYAALGGNKGDALLREQLGRQHSCDPEGIFVGNGSLQVLDLLCAELRPNGDFEVVVESPTYDRALGIFRRHGATLLGVPVQPDGMDIEQLEALLTRHRPTLIYTIADFQNPSGVTLSTAKRHRLLALAREHDMIVVEDLPYRALRYHGRSPPSLADLADGARVIGLCSLSKTLSPGLRIGYAMTDAATARSLAHRAENTYLCASPLCQGIAARALSQGLMDVSLAQTRQTLAARHDAAWRVAHRLLGDALMARPDGGYFMSALLPCAFSETQLITRASDRGVALTPGSHFFPPDRVPAQHFFLRIPFQSLGADRLALALEAVVDATGA
ncbi:PLP-dependent aminotransferase family protein [Mitsuaria sp. WAJ17]|uniref:aminotransferase-like domain-containing protein n=1 Tax=Mitsuaria sp. WAJ17 TaxID=2761452 RepID=UPI0016043B17|nr:PLP-dependent aminotransferase family protein [Mitsuaria sp. WAJ17]MBB2487889.1 PLP-dependent aminotransferase family protein [Mitsuaria sp. WAJ17]